MTFEEYCLVRKRMKKGKQFLQGKWGSDDPKIQKLIALWHYMADSAWQWQNENGYYPGGKEWKGMDEFLKLEQ